MYASKLKRVAARKARELGFLATETPRHIVKEVRRRAVALTRRGFQLLTIDHGHATTAVGNQPCLLERAGDHRDRWPAHTEHHGDKLLGERELTSSHTVLRHQQPSRQPLFNRVDGVAGR